MNDLEQAACSQSADATNEVLIDLRPAIVVTAPQPCTQRPQTGPPPTTRLRDPGRSS